MKTMRDALIILSGRDMPIILLEQEPEPGDSRQYRAAERALMGQRWTPREADNLVHLIRAGCF